MKARYLQVELGESRARAEHAARLLDVDPDLVRGKLLNLWEKALDGFDFLSERDFVVETANPEKTLAELLRWQGPVTDIPGPNPMSRVTSLNHVTLVHAFSAAGFVEVVDNGLRIRGMDRYQRLVSRRNKWRERQAKSRSTKQGGSKATVAKEARGRPEMSRVTSLVTSRVMKTTGGRGSSPLSPPQQPAPPAQPERGEHAGGDRSQSDADAFLWWAQRKRQALGFKDAPGPHAREWAAYFFAKYQPTSLEPVQAAYESFLQWATTDGRTPGWGLWVREEVWLPRWDEERIKRGHVVRPGQRGLPLGPINAVGGR